MNLRLALSIALLSCLFTSLVVLAPVPARAAAKDACSLITSADAQAALGEPVSPPRNEPRPEGSACRFRSTQGSALSAKTVTLSVHYSDTDISGNEGGMADSLKAAGYKNVQQISGVGDAAVWGTNTMMGKPTGELAVRKGKNLILTIIISGIQDEATALARAKALAATILPKA
ncbi:MAG: hypothetical protein ACLP3R_10680 [Candidatus Korobacteraceae bacterium]|jgi:hypothetical protein